MHLPKTLVQFNEKYAEGVWTTDRSTCSKMVRRNCPHLIYPEHPRALDADRELPLQMTYPGGGAYAGFVSTWVTPELCCKRR